MKIVLTNDDGIDAEGLEALESIAAAFGEVMVIAPQKPYSGCGHQTTTHRPIGIACRDEHHLAVDGTPADCVRLALTHLCPDADWVFAGINDGGNLGVDVIMSGTVAAAREAAWFGLPAVAFSQYRRRDLPLSWSTAAAWAEHTLQKLLTHQCPKHMFWNVNFPHADDLPTQPELALCHLEPTPLPVAYDRQSNSFQFRGDYHSRPREAGSDVDVCFSGRIAVSRIWGLHSDPDHGPDLAGF